MKKILMLSILLFIAHVQFATAFPYNGMSAVYRQLQNNLGTRSMIQSFGIKTNTIYDTNLFSLSMLGIGNPRKFQLFAYYPPYPYYRY
jgi:hypothetical protein